MKSRTIILLLWTFALIFWNISVWQSLIWTNKDKLFVAFLDVGQGDAIFIQAPNGRQMLIDGGEDKAVVDGLKDVMPRIDRSIDIVLATHPDADHIGGLDDVLRAYEVSYIIDNGREDKETYTFETFQSEIQNEKETSGATYIQAKHGMKIILDVEKNVYFEIFYPTDAATSEDSNELSIVGKLVYGETEFLFTGDAGIEVEQKLISWCVACLKSDVLKVGHHGSKTSTGQAFLDAVQPAYGIISAAKNNSYGHPNKEVMDRLEKKNIKILETAKEGTVMLESDGKQVGEARLVQLSSK